MTYIYSGKEVIQKINNLFIMKVYVAKDWTGVWVFANQPHLSEQPGGVPPTWNGYKLTFFKLAEDWKDKLKINTFDKFDIWWSIGKIIK